MIDFLCKLWPYLAGGLIGWLLAGWMARRFKHIGPSKETTVDNPEHLALISKLQNENKEVSSLRTKLAGFESAAGSTRTVDNPAHLKRIDELEAEIKTLKGKTKSSSTRGAAKAKSTTTKKARSTSTKISTPRSSNADKAAAKAAGFRVKVRDGKDDFTVVEGVGPKINGLIHDAGIHVYAKLAKTKVEKIQKILDDAGPRYKLAKPGTWPAQAELAAKNKWAELKAWQDELDGGK